MRTIVLLICTSFIAQMIVGAVPPSVGGTTFVLSQRQLRQDAMALRRRNMTNIRLDRVRQQRLRQQQVRDQNRERSRRSHAASTPERLAVRQQQDRDQHSQSRAALSPERLAVRQQQDRDQHSRIRATYTPERLVQFILS